MTFDSATTATMTLKDFIIVNALKAYTKAVEAEEANTRVVGERAVRERGRGGLLLRSPRADGLEASQNV